MICYPLEYLIGFIAPATNFNSYSDKFFVKKLFFSKGMISFNYLTDFLKIGIFSMDSASRSTF